MANPLSLLSGLALSACSVVGIRTEEEPRYTVRAIIAGMPTVEIRDYAPRVAAETDVPGDAYAARGEGFRRVAAYIFGANTTRAKIAMTAPVGQSSDAAKSSAETIAMTAPVAQAPTAAQGGWTIRFFMPARYTLETLPVPNDARVRLVEVPTETVAVLRFTGIASPAAVEERQRALLARLDASGWKSVGQPFAWFYDPPWTLPPLRRNEAVVQIAPR